MVSLRGILELLHEVSQREGTSKCFIVGGTVRDKIIGNLNSSFNDIDLTTGDNSVFHLAKEFSLQLRKYTKLLTKQSDDGHISIFLPSLKIDFSSNFNVPGIDDILRQRGILSTSMHREVYSRDFTVDTLLMSLDFRHVTDITGEGIRDIKSKIIRTCLTPELSLKFNTKRIIRTLYLSAKLDFDVDPQIIEWVSKNQKYNLEPGPEYLSKNLNKALTFDADRTIYLLNKMNLWKFVPLTSQLYPYYKKHILGNIGIVNVKNRL